MNRLSIGAGLVLLVFALPATATTDRFIFRGQSVSAWFEKSNECGFTYVTVNGYVNVDREELEVPGTQPLASVVYWVNDWCKGNFEVIPGDGSNVKIQIVSPLKSASLTGTIPLQYENAGFKKTIKIDLHWMGVGKITPDYNVYITRTPLYRLMNRDFETRRDADISGNIWLESSDGSTSLIEHLVDEDSLDQGLLNYGASINSSRKGTLIITKY